MGFRESGSQASLDTVLIPGNLSRIRIPASGRRRFAGGREHARWRHQPDHRLSWDETVEDMSIAVGEDLFPFFRKIGTTLTKERFAQAVFEGKTMDLPVAPLKITPAGPVRLEPIGHYKEPLTVKSRDR